MREIGCCIAIHIGDSLEIGRADPIAAINREVIAKYPDRIVMDGPFIAIRGDNSFAHYKIIEESYIKDQYIVELVKAELYGTL